MQMGKTMEEKTFREHVSWVMFLLSILVIWAHSYNAELFSGGAPVTEGIWLTVHRIQDFLSAALGLTAVPGFFMLSAYLFFRSFSWEKLPGKSERWLMTTIRDNTTMFFGGKDTPAAFVNFKILGSLGRENCEILNEEFLTDVSQVLGIQKERIFVAHDECPSWGWVKN